MSTWKNIVDVKWLKQQLDQPDVIILDCRYSLNEPSKGKKLYEAGHIPDARYLDLGEDLSGPVQVHGGRHPLPVISTFVNTISELGIDNQTKVIAYDDQGGMFAARLWWMLKYVGHEDVYILDGGYSAWVREGLSVTKEIPVVRKREFKPSLQHDMLVQMEDVLDKIHRPKTAIIDSRSEERYLGLHEPLDKKAGHIPSALHFFWAENVDEAGRWKRENNERFENLREKDEFIIYCGSGVSACPNIIAMLEAGFTNVKLYAGSWSDWSSYATNPIETKKRS